MPRPHALSPQDVTPLRGRDREPGRTYASDPDHHTSVSVQRHGRSPPRTVSAWRDFLVTALIGTIVSGALAYFLGLLITITVIVAAIVVLGLCLNYVINHTIEL